MSDRTADFAYVRWLGDRAGIEKLTREWNRTVINRVGHSIDSIELFHRLWQEGGKESPGGT